jgi:DNA-binding NarL/FixJ family response regulator
MRILLADDHDIVRRGLRNLLQERLGWTVVAEATNGMEAIEKESTAKPDVTLLDIEMPIMGGLPAAREILKSGSKTKILILTMHESDAVIRAVLDSGARGYVLKSDAARDLPSAVEAVRHNKTYFTSKVAQMLREGYLTSRKKPDDAESNGSRLTPRQREIVQLLAGGMSTKDAAIALGVSQKTLETHRANIMRRLDCHSASELVRYALRNEIIEA